VNMKVICIKDTVTKDSSEGYVECCDPFLVLGRVYDALYKGDEVIIFDGGINWISYDSNSFVSQEEWRDMKLNDLGIV